MWKDAFFEKIERHFFCWKLSNFSIKKSIFALSTFWYSRNPFVYKQMTIVHRSPKLIFFFIFIAKLIFYHWRNDKEIPADEIFAHVVPSFWRKKNCFIRLKNLKCILDEEETISQKKWKNHFLSEIVQIFWKTNNFWVITIFYRYIVFVYLQ